MAKIRDNGSDTKAQSKECNDRNCPVHGSISVRGRSFVGKVTSAKAHRTAIVVLERLVFVKKFQRYMHRYSKIAVHVPDCIPVKEGDVVKFSETRPISKTKHFVVVEKLGNTK